MRTSDLSPSAVQTPSSSVSHFVKSRALKSAIVEKYKKVRNVVLEDLKHRKPWKVQVNDQTVYSKLNPYANSFSPNYMLNRFLASEFPSVSNRFQTFETGVPDDALLVNSAESDSDYDSDNNRDCGNVDVDNNDRLKLDSNDDSGNDDDSS